MFPFIHRWLAWLTKSPSEMTSSGTCSVNPQPLVIFSQLWYTLCFASPLTEDFCLFKKKIHRLHVSKKMFFTVFSQGPWGCCIRCHYHYDNLVFVLMLYFKCFFKCCGTLGKECFTLPGHLERICCESTIQCIRSLVRKQAEQSKVTSRRWFNA